MAGAGAIADRITRTARNAHRRETQNSRIVPPERASQRIPNHLMNERTSELEPGGRLIFRRVIFALACVATLLAVFYTVARAHGRRVWENCRHELEAKGASLDWAAYIPPPVPDEQNIFKAPKMAEWFVKPSPGMGNFQSPIA